VAAMIVRIFMGFLPLYLVLLGHKILSRLKLAPRAC
jgi:hypothetical protein